MNKMKVLSICSLLTVSSATFMGVTHAQEILKVGISAPMSGAAANWGLGQEWAAKQAAKEIKDAGGVKVGGKSYNFEVIAYDNKYSAAEGTKIGQTLINRDGAKYIVGGIGTAPILALQSLTERNGVLMFQSAWGKSLKGPKHPLTFTQSNTPFEILEPLYGYIKQQNPKIKTVAILNPNDATGKETLPVSQKVWKDLGVEVVNVSWYERGTTQFQPIATKLAGLKPDVIDIGTTPPADAGVILKELDVLGWKGVKTQPAGTNADQVVKIAGKAADGLYMGFSGDYGGPQATPKQRELNKGMIGALGETINPLQIAAYDSVYALKAAMESANSVDPKVVAKTLPNIVFETSYGKTAFGGTDMYGSPQQILIPVMVTQIQDGKVNEVKRIAPAELQKRLTTK
jgi:branched-chain amino acid transport system substrate-binding protein